MTYSGGLLSKLQGGGEKCGSNHRHSPHWLLTPTTTVHVMYLRTHDVCFVLIPCIYSPLMTPMVDTASSLL
jgi:hypothetical protein